MHKDDKTKLMSHIAAAKSFLYKIECYERDDAWLSISTRMKEDLTILYKKVKERKTTKVI